MGLGMFIQYGCFDAKVEFTCMAAWLYFDNRGVDNRMLINKFLMLASLYS